MNIRGRFRPAVPRAREQDQPAHHPQRGGVRGAAGGGGCDEVLHAIPHNAGVIQWSAKYAFSMKADQIPKIGLLLVFFLLKSLLFWDFS